MISLFPANRALASIILEYADIPHRSVNQQISLYVLSIFEKSEGFVRYCTYLTKIRNLFHQRHVQWVSSIANDQDEIAKQHCLNSQKMIVEGINDTFKTRQGDITIAILGIARTEPLAYLASSKRVKKIFLLNYSCQSTALVTKTLSEESKAKCISIEIDLTGGFYEKMAEIFATYPTAEDVRKHLTLLYNQTPPQLDMTFTGEPIDYVMSSMIAIQLACSLNEISASLFAETFPNSSFATFMPQQLHANMQIGHYRWLASIAKQMPPRGRVYLSETWKISPALPFLSYLTKQQAPPVPKETNLAHNTVSSIFDIKKLHEWAFGTTVFEKQLSYLWTSGYLLTPKKS